MIKDTDVKLIIGVFNKAELNDEEKAYLNTLNLIQEKVDLHNEFVDRLKVIDGKLNGTIENK